jgi:TDG/mug DNA glycosylase family protein
MPLRDVLVSRPRVLFVGINPSLRSEEVGHHFAGRGNPFWRLLHAARLTPHLLTHVEDARLADLGMALTNLCTRATRSASELRREEIERGRRALERKIRDLRPALVALVGVTLYQVVLGRSRLGGGGPGPKPDRICGARVFVLPNPSGLNASFPGFADKLEWFARLRELVDGPSPGRPTGHAPSDRGGSGRRTGPPVTGAAAPRARGSGSRRAKASRSTRPRCR